MSSNPPQQVASSDSVSSGAEPSADDGPLHHAANWPYVKPVEVPTVLADEGIRFDFNFGARVALPKCADGEWHLELYDVDAESLLYRCNAKEGIVFSTKKFYVKFRVIVRHVASDGKARLVLDHELDLTNKLVVVQLPVGTLGDSLGWFPYVARFARTTGARVVVMMAEVLIPLLGPSYSDMELMTKAQYEASTLNQEVYATYNIGLFFKDKDNLFQPSDFRFVGLHRTAAYILGVDPTEEPPVFTISDDSRPIPEPYVCIATQATTQSKYWNNPEGWQGVCNYLKGRGYRVICIDRQMAYGSGLVWNHIPHGAEDQTGDRPLEERVRWLKHADLFIGLSSGLSWLAWGARTKVVMISGFTHPLNEFHTPWRVINWHVCNSCWNDPAYTFVHDDFLWCPRHANTSRHYECTKAITAGHVIKEIAKALESPTP